MYIRAFILILFKWFSLYHFLTDKQRKRCVGSLPVYYVLLLFVYSFNSFAMSWFINEPKELLEMKIDGTYYPGGPEEIEDYERYYRERGLLKEGETLADLPTRFAHKLKYLGKERFRMNGRSMTFCYEKIMDEDREKATVIDPNLRARIYDKEGNLLAEDILRDRKPESYHPFPASTVAYLPYLNNSDVILRIVRLKGEEEIVLYEIEDMDFYAHELLKERDLYRHLDSKAHIFYAKGESIITSLGMIYRFPFSCYW